MLEEEEESGVSLLGPRRRAEPRSGTSPGKARRSHHHLSLHKQSEGGFLLGSSKPWAAAAVLNEDGQSVGKSNSGDFSTIMKPKKDRRGREA